MFLCPNLKCHYYEDIGLVIEIFAMEQQYCKNIDFTIKIVIEMKWENISSYYWYECKHTKIVKMFLDNATRFNTIKFA